VIQDRTTVQIAIPDFTKLTRPEACAILRAADLIRGAAISVPWEGIGICLRPRRSRLLAAF
jgi:hypothetical protein